MHLLVHLIKILGDEFGDDLGEALGVSFCEILCEEVGAKFDEELLYVLGDALYDSLHKILNE